MWQQDLIKIIQQDGGNNRKVYWISGYKGNEGKSWMQCYVEAYYGYSRVIHLEIRNKTSNILRALTKRPLQTTDIFLFNDTLATNRDVETNYAVLKLIKDGNAISRKYNSQILTFEVPNIVIVFSNYMPDEEKVSKDRWEIYTVGKHGLAME